jgi:hypothetical protein
MKDPIGTIIGYLWNLFHAQSSLVGDEALHLLTFGLLGALCTFFFGPGSAIVLGVWRFYAEYEFLLEGTENPNGLRFPMPGWVKAGLDWICQVGPAIIVAIVR